MFDWVRQQVLRLMRVPHEPTAPLGAPGSVRIFRAGRNYFKIRLVRWGLGQVGALIGLLFSLSFFWWFKADVEANLQAAAQAVQAAPEPHPATANDTPTASNSKALPRSRGKRVPMNTFIRGAAQRTPAWGLVVVEVVEAAGILLFLVQIPVTLALARLEYELHWYIVTDRSLRIRTGVLRLQESTMSFANLQQVEVQQGPIQRLLGLADVHVQSAGGGSGHQDSRHGKEVDSLHTGIFHSVDNATEIRDLILDRLRQFRQTGLGDPDEHHDHPPMIGPVPTAVSPPDTLAAAHELLAEARALRQVLS